MSISDRYPGPSTLGGLEANWTVLLARLGIPCDRGRASFTVIQQHYSEPARAYHHLGHIEEVLETVRHLSSPGEAGPALLLAGWLHDLIYDPRRNDNEERSVQRARALLEPLGGAPALLDEVGRLILLTRGHDPEEEDEAGKILVDADLAILGSPPARYQAYARAIRAEYAWVPEGVYRDKRREILERFLARPRLYRTAELFGQAERQARENLLREQNALQER
jgi:predicted metal-dependent HD superfamily phosphohydrolase